MDERNYSPAPSEKQSPKFFSLPSRLLEPLLGLNSSAQKVYLALLRRHLREPGRCWPSNDELAAECLVSARSVQLATAELHRQGLIEKQKTNPGGAGGGLNSYRVCGFFQTFETPYANPEEGGERELRPGAKESFAPKDQAFRDRASLQDPAKSGLSLPTVEKDLPSVSPIGETSPPRGGEGLFPEIGKAPSVRKPRGRRGYEETEDFLTFYRAFPRKVAKADACKAWHQTKKDRPPLPRLLRTLERQADAEDWANGNKQHCPYPASWLRGKRWEDEIEEPKPDPRDWGPAFMELWKQADDRKKGG